MKLIEDLNQRYARLHTAKEDAFWVQKMGTAEDSALAQADFDAKEIELQRFLQDPEQITRVRAALEAARASAGADEVLSLEGWLATFEAHAIEGREARALAEEIVAAEGRLAQARGSLQLSYRDEQGKTQPASSVKLGALLRSDRDPGVRRSAWESLRSIEHHVLAAGFLDVIRARNRLGRMLGAEDYYDWKTRRVERMSKAEVFALLDELEARTRDKASAAVRELATRSGPEAIQPWNIQFATAGDSTREQDPYFPFADAVRRWGHSFAALGITYHGAEMLLDLVDRRGKYENGFMHGPVVAWRDRGRRIPARIHFTANAIPGMVGSGFRASETLFHEGGHAAHFANIDMPAPCFGQEFAPTSVGFSETQSMFLDSLLRDVDWQARYALDRKGEALPWEIMERAIRASQPFAAWHARGMLAVCYAERALYEIPDEELTSERALAEVRAVERRLLFLEEGGPRPVLAVPHLLAGESSAYYHGYVLAEMAVETTRDFFLERDGHICDNPRVGADLARAYWQPGNSLSFLEFIPRLTSRELGAGALARRLSIDVEPRLAEARRTLEHSRSKPRVELAPALDARLRIVHGRETVAELRGSFDEFAADFARWIGAAERAG
ncbi:MAG TPA: M3 family metallopeptidase [Planctomycetota bacterium]|nr:M3 family metallopeptidase [Planctomycetota bacterium]